MIVSLLFLAAAAAPVAAAPPLPPYADAPTAIPRELTDPAMADRLGRTMGAMAQAVMNLPVGEIQAAIEGRPATPADRSRRVRDIAGSDGKRLADHVARDSAATGRAVQGVTRAMVASLPAIVQAMRGAEAEIARATANLPDPTYPRR